jgi:hypothetical protein
MGEGDEAAAIDDDLIGEATVDRHAVEAGETGAAQLRLPGDTTVALAAPHVGLDRDRGPVIEDPRELVTERHRQVPCGEVEVGAADAARHHADAHRIRRVCGDRGLDVGHPDPAVA